MSNQCCREVEKDKDRTVPFRFNVTEVTGDNAESLVSPEDNLQ